jgi:hypothetical protein
VRRLGWLITAGLLALQMAALAQGADGGEKGPLPADLAAALDRLGVPPEVWVIVSPEVARALVSEPVAADGKWQTAAWHAGCKLRESRWGTAVVSADLPSGLPASDGGHLANSAAEDFASVLAGTPPDLRSILCSGAWVPVSVLGPEAQRALGRLMVLFEDGGEHQIGAPGTYFALMPNLKCSVRMADPERGTRGGLWPILHEQYDRELLVEVGPATGTGSPCLAHPAYRQAMAVPSAPPACWPERDSIAPIWAAMASVPTRTVKTLAEWMDANALPREARLDSRYASHLVSVPAGPRSARDAGALLSAAAGIGARVLAGVCFITVVAPSEGRDKEAAGDDAESYALVRALGRHLTSVQWRVGMGRDLPEPELDALLSGSWHTIPDTMGSALFAALVGTIGGYAVGEDGRPLPEYTTPPAPVTEAMGQLDGVSIEFASARRYARGSVAYPILGPKLVALGAAEEPGGIYCLTSMIGRTMPARWMPASGATGYGEQVWKVDDEAGVLLY